MTEWRPTSIERVPSQFKKLVVTFRVFRTAILENLFIHLFSHAEAIVVILTIFFPFTFYYFYFMYYFLYLNYEFILLILTIEGLQWRFLAFRRFNLDVISNKIKQ